MKIKIIFTHSLPEFNLPLFWCIYVTHVSRALQSHDLSGEEINSGSHRPMGGSPGELSDELVTQVKQRKVWRVSCCFTYVNVQNSFSNFSVTSPTSQLILQHFAPPTSQLILQPFRCFTYVNVQNSFSNFSVTSPMLQLILQPFRCFTYATAHSPTFPLFHLRHSSSSNPFVALPTSQLIIQPFCCFTYLIAHSRTLLSLLLRHNLFTYVTWRAAHMF